MLVKYKYVYHLIFVFIFSFFMNSINFLIRALSHLPNVRLIESAVCLRKYYRPTVLNSSCKKKVKSVKHILCSVTYSARNCKANWAWLWAKRHIPSPIAWNQGRPLTGSGNDSLFNIYIQMNFIREYKIFKNN
jgi:hypothetical protein